MPRRSVLFSPGDRPELMRKAPAAGADTVVFDLEDAVGPDRKAVARDAVRELLADPAFDPDGVEVCVRVDAGERGVADVEAVLGRDDEIDGSSSRDASRSGNRETPPESRAAGATGPGDREARSASSNRASPGDDVRLDAVMVPKVSGPDDVVRVADALAEAGREPPVLALIESAAGVLSARAVASVGPTDALAFGAEDLAADVGATRTDEGTEVLYAREHVVLAASAAGIDAIDTVYTDFEDEAGLREETEFALTLGYDGKMAIHPAQVSPINGAFTPAPERVEWAERVLDAREAADGGVFRVEGEMIDAPLIAQAERIVERARAADE